MTNEIYSLLNFEISGWFLMAFALWFIWYLVRIIDRLQEYRRLNQKDDNA
jgi:hypothetical protein